MIISVLLAAWLSPGPQGSSSDASTERLGHPPVTGVHRTAQMMQLDGRLDEPAWRAASPARVSRQKLPAAGGPVTQPTEFRLLATSDALWIGVRCTQSVPLVPRRTRRDRAVESDRITVDIDSRGRRKDAFHFEVTAGGTLVDGVRYNDTTLDLQWDGFWDAAVERDAAGWTAELKIPFRVLRRPPEAVGEIAVQVRRYVSRLGETDEWAPTPRDNSQEVRRYGSLAGFDLPRRRVDGEVLPYFTVGGAVETATPSSPALVHRVGGDAKLRAGSDLTIDATVLPDFGTVEADTAVFNLSTAELRFPEKRPFFIEGLDVFATPLEVFYTRRIGSLTGATAGNAIGNTPPAPVLGATKLLARAGGRGTVAALVATSGHQDVLVRDAERGVTAPQRVAPVYTYGVVRGMLELPHASHVGATAASRLSFDPGLREPWSSCPDGRPPRDGACFHDAYLGSADFLLRSASSRWVGQAQVVGTYRQGGSDQAQLDGNLVRSGEGGAATRLRVDKAGGRIIGYTNWEWLGRDADWSATGFLPIPNRHNLRSEVAVQTLTPRGPVLEDRWQVEHVQKLTLDRHDAGSAYQLNYRAKWKTFWYSFTELHLRPHYRDNREARDGTLVERAGVFGWEQTINSDHRRLVAAALEGTWQVRTTGGLGHYGQRAEGNFDVDLNPAAPLQVRLGLTGTWDDGELRFLEDDADAGVRRFGRLHAGALGFLTRLNYTITPKLEVQLYVQLLGAGTSYDDGRIVSRDDGFVDLAELRPDPAFAARRESEAFLVGNLFLRWEYATGSNLFFVLTRNQLDPLAPEGQGGLDFAAVGRSAAAYTFLVKLTRLLPG